LANKGRIFSAEHIRKLSESHKGQIPTFTGTGLKGYKHSEKSKLNMSDGQKKVWADRSKRLSDKIRLNISKGQSNKRYSEEYKQKMSLVKAKECISGVGRDIRFNYKNMFFRSNAEVIVAKWLDSKNINWEYESEMFLLDNGRHYIPDFKLENGEYLEVKNRFNNRDKIKLKLFSQNHILKLVNYKTMNIEVFNGRE
jgi:hypothetical protein